MYRSRPSDFRLPFETLPARRQKKLRLPNGSVVVMTPCAVEIAGGSVGGKALMLREPVRRDRIVTILPSGKVGRELVKKRAPPGEANCVVVRQVRVKNAMTQEIE